MSEKDELERIKKELYELREPVAELKSSLGRIGVNDGETDGLDDEELDGFMMPEETGHAGAVPTGFVETLSIPPRTDSECAEANLNDNPQHFSLDKARESPPPGVTQIHKFDEAPLSNAIRFTLAVETTGSASQRRTRIVLNDPDSDSGFQTKWMIPVRRTLTDGSREIVWVCVGGGVDVSAAAAESALPYAPPDYDPLQPEGYNPDPEHPDPEHYDPTVPDPIYVPVPNPDYDPVHPDPAEPPFIYLRLDGLFWLRGGTAATNYGRSLKLGANNNFVTISAS